MHARYYSPTLGRFFSVDSVLDLDNAMHNAQDWNRYSYVVNNPMNRTDPTGNEEKKKVPQLDNIQLVYDPNDHLGLFGAIELAPSGEARPTNGWYAVVYKDSTGTLFHEAVVKYEDGTPTKVYEHSAGWTEPRQGIPYAASLASTGVPAAAKYLGAKFAPEKVPYNNTLNRFFQSRFMQCTDYSQFLQKGWFPPAREAITRQRVLLGDRVDPGPLSRYFYRFNYGYHPVPGDQ
jgi:hypothetical protein